MSQNCDQIQHFNNDKRNIDENMGEYNIIVYEMLENKIMLFSHKKKHKPMFFT